MYLVRLRKPPKDGPGDWKHCQDIAKLALAGVGVGLTSPSNVNGTNGTSSKNS